MNVYSTRKNSTFMNTTQLEIRHKRGSLSISINKNTDFTKVILPSIKNDKNSSVRLPSSNYFSISPSHQYSQRKTSISSFGYQEISYPISSNLVLKSYNSFLSEYELIEIKEYPVIYYLSNKDKKLSVNYLERNFGFDNEKGFYKIIVGEHLAYRYEILEILGQGSFGQVCKCLDHKTKEKCAIKIIRNKQRFHKQAQIEINILKYITSEDPQNSANVLHLEESFKFRNHLCLKFELYGQNLYKFMKNCEKSGLPTSVLKAFSVQIAESLRFLNTISIIHCDLKPENILLADSESTRLKIIDFGSACLVGESTSSYIQSRYYRSPEVILEIPYDFSIDVWSFGCILAELCIGFPLFPGENEKEQLMYIMEYLGLPPKEVLINSKRVNEFFDIKGEPLYIVNSNGKVRIPGSKKLNDKIKTSDYSLLDLIQSKIYSECLCWDAKVRITSNEILAHEWIVGKSKRKIRIAK